jgi:hypothetical protein
LKKRLRAGIPSRFSLISRLDSKKLLILMGVVTITLLVDSQIGYVADFIPEQLSSSTGVAGFIGIAIIFAVTQYFILAYIKLSNRESQVKAINLDLMHRIVSIAQYVCLSEVLLTSNCCTLLRLQSTIFSFLVATIRRQNLYLIRWSLVF